ncbi:MAG: hypothetical protein ACK5B9_11880 [Flavobacteriia bacterium]|jgi:hypothetical protein
MLTLCVNYGYSQVAKPSQIQEKEIVKLVYSETEEVAEITLSPEEQGFKLLIIENKIIYRKEVNGIIVEFIPEEK